MGPTTIQHRFMALHQMSFIMVLNCLLLLIFFNFGQKQPLSKNTWTLLFHWRIKLEILLMKKPLKKTSEFSHIETKIDQRNRFKSVKLFFTNNSNSQLVQTWEWNLNLLVPMSSLIWIRTIHLQSLKIWRMVAQWKLISQIFNCFLTILTLQDCQMTLKQHFWNNYRSNQFNLLRKSPLQLKILKLKSLIWNLINSFLMTIQMMKSLILNWILVLTLSNCVMLALTFKQIADVNQLRHNSNVQIVPNLCRHAHVLHNHKSTKTTSFLHDQDGKERERFVLQMELQFK